MFYQSMQWLVDFKKSWKVEVYFYNILFHPFSSHFALLLQYFRKIISDFSGLLLIKLSKYFVKTVKYVQKCSRY